MPTIIPPRRRCAWPAALLAVLLTLGAARAAAPTAAPPAAPAASPAAASSPTPPASPFLELASLPPLLYDGEAPTLLWRAGAPRDRPARLVFALAGPKNEAPPAAPAPVALAAGETRTVGLALPAGGWTGLTAVLEAGGRELARAEVLLRRLDAPESKELAARLDRLVDAQGRTVILTFARPTGEADRRWWLGRALGAALLERAPQGVLLLGPRFDGREAGPAATAPSEPPEYIRRLAERRSGVCYAALPEAPATPAAGASPARPILDLLARAAAWSAESAATPAAPATPAPSATPTTPEAAVLILDADDARLATPLRLYRMALEAALARLAGAGVRALFVVAPAAPAVEAEALAPYVREARAACTATGARLLEAEALRAEELWRVGEAGTALGRRPNANFQERLAELLERELTTTAPAAPGAGP